MEISPRQLQHVLAIDRFRHFSQAADYLGISQPALSRSLAALESHLGLRLFLRDRSGVEPTPGGLEVIAFARNARKAALDLSAALEELRGGKPPRLRLACGAFAAELSVAQALGRAAGESPETRISIEVTDWFDALTRLRARRCDLTLCELNPDFIASDLRTRPIGHHAVHLLARQGHPLTRRRRLGLDDVLAYPWACSRIPMRALTHIGDRTIEAGEIDVARGMLVPRIVTPSVLGMLSMLPHTDALAPAPLSLAAPMLERNEISLVDFRAPWLKLNYGFAWHAHVPLTETAKRFMGAVETTEAGVRDREAVLAKLYGR